MWASQVRASPPLLGLVLVACGAGNPAQSTAEVGSADPVAMRDLLRRNSPRGHQILTTYEQLPTQFDLPEGAYQLSSPDSFDRYFSDGAPWNVARFMNTGIHEITHGYTTRVAFQQLASQGLPYEEGAAAILGAGDPTLVRYTQVFPAREIGATYPSEARTTRFAVYVEPGSEDHATQRYGVYGLLDEYAAALQGAQTSMDFWPWVRGEASRDRGMLINYAVLLDDALAAHSELRFFILHYLLHARTHRPEVFEEILSNNPFRAAFADVDGAMSDLAEAARALEPEVHRLAAESGVRIERRGALIAVDGQLQRPASGDPLQAIRSHLLEPEYESLLARL